MRTIYLLCLICFCLPVWGQYSGTTSPPKTPGVDSTWPGIVMQIAEIKRLPNKRLLFAIRLIATAEAPGSTLIGTENFLPANATDAEKQMQMAPSPFSLQGSTLTDERTGQSYEMLAPDPRAPPCLPSAIMGTLSPGQALYLSIQFAAPPPPPPDNNGVVPKQMVSILLPKAQGPILHIVVPPDSAANSATAP